MTAAAIKARAQHSAASVDWGTPPAIVELARAVMGGIDCDPCSSGYWNTWTVKAWESWDENTPDVTTYTEAGGLIRDGRPMWDRFFINPPKARGAFLSLAMVGIAFQMVVLKLAVRVDELAMRRRARRAVRHAVANGALPPVSSRTCTDCGERASQYDHHRGYEGVAVLDVQPVCMPCHRKRGVERGEVATGNANGQRKYPERTVRGDRHYARHSPELLARGEAHGCAKLDESAVLQIRARAAAGEVHMSLAAEFGVKTSTIESIAKRRTWRHLP